MLRDRTQLLLLVTLLVLIGGVWGFVELADDVMEGDTQHFDDRVVKALRNKDNPEQLIGPKWVEEVARDFTALGGIAVMSLATLAVAGYLLITRKFHAMWLVIVSTVGGFLVSLALKSAFDRQRPDLVPHLSHVHTSSFPSGHSMMSAVVYLTLGALLMRLVPSRIVKVYFLAIAVLITTLVGISRVYMGVHFPTDVLAGWTAGMVWALLCWTVARWLQRRGAVERDDNGLPSTHG